jgi:hypothetical protein
VTVAPAKVNVGVIVIKVLAHVNCAEAVYVVVALANVGVYAILTLASVTAVNEESVETVDGCRVATIEYVFVVTPSWAVTTILILFVPTFKLIEPLGDPDVTETPLTVIVANALFLVGVTVTDVVVFTTLSVYDVVAELNEGDSVPLEIVKADNVASLLSADDPAPKPGELANDTDVTCIILSV